VLESYTALLYDIILFSTITERPDVAPITAVRSLPALKV
jgi:hypothetical protein